MSNKAVLEAAAQVFRQMYPKLSAEAIVCFLIILDLGEPTVGDVAAAVGMAEPNAYHHIAQLAGTGAGLIKLINQGDGSNTVRLTSAGLSMRSAVMAVFG